MSPKHATLAHLRTYSRDACLLEHEPLDPFGETFGRRSSLGGGALGHRPHSDVRALRRQAHLSYNDAVRRRFSTVLALSLLVVVACVYADAFLLHGSLFERGLEIWRLELYVDQRLPLTLAFAGAVCHPVLFIAAAIALLVLPPPKNDFFRNLH